MPLSRQRWALTGAAGHIGSTLRAGLRDEVAELCCIDIQPIVELGANERGAEIDLADLAAMERSLRTMDGVIHLGAIADEGELHDIIDANVTGTFNLFEAARRAGVPRVVFASSNHVTGLYPVGVRVNPMMPPRPDGFYGVSKVAGEAIGRLYAEKFDMRVACLRIGSFAERPTEQRHLSTWASHADTVRAFRAAMTTPELTFAVFYVASANRDLFWDLDAGARLGFHPEDRAEHFGDDLGGPIYELQGGPHASPAYTLSRQRKG